MKTLNLHFSSFDEMINTIDFFKSIGIKLRLIEFPIFFDCNETTIFEIL